MHLPLPNGSIKKFKYDARAIPEDGEYLVNDFLLAAQETDTRRLSRFIMISSEELVGLTFSRYSLGYINSEEAPHAPS